MRDEVISNRMVDGPVQTPASSGAECSSHLRPVVRRVYKTWLPMDRGIERQQAAAPS